MIRGRVEAHASAIHTGTVRSSDEATAVPTSASRTR